MLAQPFCVVLEKKLKNKFWEQVLFSTRSISEGAIFHNPGRLSLSSFWNNQFIKRNNKVITHRDFPELVGTISTLSDFFYPSTNNMMSKDDFCNRYDIDIDTNKYIDIRYIITVALQQLRLPRHKLFNAEYPMKPLLIETALAIKK